jgi:hypothetical protein
MKNKLIFGILAIIMIGSIVGITAYNTISPDELQKITTAEGNTISAANTWTANEYTWFSEAGDNDTYFQCHVGDTIKLNSMSPYAVEDDKMQILAHGATAHNYFKITSGKWPKDVTFTAAESGDYSIRVCDLFVEGNYNQKRYYVTVLP